LYPYSEDEIISALHKCIRAGDFFSSCYFAKVIKENIGVWRVKQYIFYICFEETLNINLYKKLKELFKKEDNFISDKDIYEVLYYFCKCSKKWETQEGRNFLMANLNSVIRSMGDYVKERKRLPDITDIDRLKYWEGVAMNDPLCFGKRSKKFRKSKHYGIPELYYYTEKAVNDKNSDDLLYLAEMFFENKDVFDFNTLSNIEAFKHSDLYHEMNELNGKYCYIFNYLVLFYSLVNSLGEQKLPNLNEKAVLEVEEKINSLLNNQEYLEIPLIALDPHTVRGKALFSNIRFDFNTPLEGVDLRFSGKRYGVIWRIASCEQYGRIADKWEDVVVPVNYRLLYNKYCKLGYQSRLVPKQPKIQYKPHQKEA